MTLGPSPVHLPVYFPQSTARRPVGLTLPAGCQQLEMLHTQRYYILELQPHVLDRIMGGFLGVPGKYLSVFFF